jgi:Ca-activated chloride channel family protein
MFIIKTRTAMENQDKLYNNFKAAAKKAEDKSFARMDAVWNRVEDKLDNKKQRRIAAWWKYTGIAALLLLFTGIGFMLLKSNSDVIIPQAKPDNGVTVIDTVKVEKTFVPEIKTQADEQQVVTNTPDNRSVKRRKVTTPVNLREDAAPAFEKAAYKPAPPTITFTGIITDEQGVPLPGVAVLQNGNKYLTQTDLDGRYALNTTLGDTLNLSYLGYKEKAVVASYSNNSQNMAMAADAQSLEEVVVMGYRTTSRPQSNAAVASLSAKTTEARPNANFTQSLQGQVPGLTITKGNRANVSNSASIASNGYVSRSKEYNGLVNSEELSKKKSAETEKANEKPYYDVLSNGRLAERALTVAETDAESAATATRALQGHVQGVQITSASGQPGANSTLVLRGYGSVNSNLEPLYVIDGVPLNAESFKAINPDTIESVTVLKDAGATAIFGSRGANGVIVVKTKDGRMGMTKDNFKAFKKEQLRENKKLKKQQRRQEKEDRKAEKESKQQEQEEEKTALKQEREAEKAVEAERQRRLKEKIPVDSNNDESYNSFIENKFENPATTPLSTFSIDVDNASYTNIRRFLNNGQVVPKDAVRVEEMINFFKYQYPQPVGNDPFSINTEYANCPWNPNHKLLKIGLQGKDIPTSKLAASNIVFLIDVSGSMNDANKLPLLKESMKLLVKQMRKQDRIAIVVYAGAAGLVLPSTSGADKDKIYEALNKLSAGGSTAGGAGIELAYKTAQENFAKGGNNRVVLATDGDFNVGASSDGDMQTLIEAKRKSGVFLTCFGYGMGNYKDSKLETLADKGNGNYAYVDNMQEADRFLNKEFKGSMYAIAKDVKIQIEFNPKHVQSYRLIGYENRKLRDEDFANDAIDAGELGSGHTVTAFYEIIPVGVQSDYFTAAPGLKYSTPVTGTGTYNDELATIKFRYKKPDGDKSTEMVKVIAHTPVVNASDDFKFAAAVAWFGLKLRDSDLVPDKASEAILKLAKEGLKNDDEGYRAEFIRLVNRVE